MSARLRAGWPYLVVLAFVLAFGPGREYLTRLDTFLMANVEIATATLLAVVWVALAIIFWRHPHA